jgi:hypothetical protein
MKAYAFDPEATGCPCDCPQFDKYEYMSPGGDPSDKCQYSRRVPAGEKPGPDCPLEDVPENADFTFERRGRFRDACVAFVERLRSMTSSNV